MIVPVKRKDNGVNEWVIIELHGELTKEDDTAENKYVGEIYYLKCGTPVLIVGNHVLHGKEMKLDKPMAVLEKKECQDPKKSYCFEYAVQAIVRKKLLFRTRPKNLTAN